MKTYPSCVGATGVATVNPSCTSVVVITLLSKPSMNVTVYVFIVGVFVSLFSLFSSPLDPGVVAVVPPETVQVVFTVVSLLMFLYEVLHPTNVMFSCVGKTGACASIPTSTSCVEITEPS